jgi:Glyoxalase-like domain
VGHFTKEAYMPARVGNITFDCEDALKVANFWSETIGRPLDPGASRGFASIGRSDRERVEPAWFFEKVPETKAAKNRVHLDLVIEEPSAIGELVDRGASIVGEHEMGTQRWTVMLDPEGNEFCVAETSYTG